MGRPLPLLGVVLAALLPPATGIWNVHSHHHVWAAARHGHIDEVVRHLDEGERSGVGNPHPPCDPGACILTNLDPNLADPHHNWTAMHWAAIYDQHHVIEHLLAVGAHHDAVSDHQMTVLHQSARSGDLKSVRALIAHGAAIDPEDKHDATPLVHAAQKGHAAVVLELLQAGADPQKVAYGKDIEMNHVHMSARDWALHKDQHGVVAVLDKWIKEEL